MTPCHLHRDKVNVLNGWKFAKSATNFAVLLIAPFSRKFQRRGISQTLVFTLQFHDSDRILSLRPSMGPNRIHN
jgi:hypothetical protein